MMTRRTHGAHPWWASRAAPATTSLWGPLELAQGASHSQRQSFPRHGRCPHQRWLPLYQCSCCPCSRRQLTLRLGLHRAWPRQCLAKGGSHRCPSEGRCTSQGSAGLARGSGRRRGARTSWNAATATCAQKARSRPARRPRGPSCAWVSRRPRLAPALCVRLELSSNRRLWCPQTRSLRRPPQTRTRCLEVAPARSRSWLLARSGRPRVTRLVLNLLLVCNPSVWASPVRGLRSMEPVSAGHAHGFGSRWVARAAALAPTATNAQRELSRRGRSASRPCCAWA
mmetsp:Transcript_65160/g.151325  ORF Transcript_65160/g.151325 Transcript_65160/m.151325 type:complete len:283 (-) Transcript_65160:140-988(-)